MLGIRRWFKKRFFYEFFPPFFFCISRLFLWHPNFFSVKRQEKLLKLQNGWTNKTFPRKITFNQKVPLDARIAVVTTRENTFRLSVFWIKVQRSVKDYKYLKKCFSRITFTHSQIAGFANLAKVFARSRKTLRIGKKANFSVFKKLFP